MASTACFLHHHAPSTASAASRTPSQRLVPGSKPTQLICKAQKLSAAAEEELNGAVSRRLALTVLIGGAALGARVSPADAAYGEAGNLLAYKST